MSYLPYFRLPNTHAHPHALQTSPPPWAAGQCAPPLQVRLDVGTVQYRTIPYGMIMRCSVPMMKEGRPLIQGDREQASARAVVKVGLPRYGAAATAGGVIVDHLL